MIMWILLLMLIWCMMFIYLHVLKYTCIPGMNQINHGICSFWFLLDLVCEYLGIGIMLKFEFRVSCLAGIRSALQVFGLQVLYWELKKCDTEIYFIQLGCNSLSKDYLLLSMLLLKRYSEWQELNGRERGSLGFEEWPHHHSIISSLRCRTCV
jgi:hypothetical protein